MSVWLFMISALMTPIVYAVGNKLWDPSGAYTGMNDAIINYFYIHNLFNAWFTTAAFGLVFYMLPRFTGNKLYSHRLGAPTDLFLTVVNATGKTPADMAQVDDNPETLSPTHLQTATRDPVPYKFVAPADGKYLLYVGSHLSSTLADVTHQYQLRITPEKPDFRLVGVVFESPKGAYFMRFVGPQKSVEKHKKDFDAWLKSFK